MQCSFSVGSHQPSYRLQTLLSLRQEAIHLVLVGQCPQEVVLPGQRPDCPVNLTIDEDKGVRESITDRMVGMRSDISHRQRRACGYFLSGLTHGPPFGGLPPTALLRSNRLPFTSKTQ